MSKVCQAVGLLEFQGTRASLCHFRTAVLKTSVALVVPAVPAISARHFSAVSTQYGASNHMCQLVAIYALVLIIVVNVPPAHSANSGSSTWRTALQDFAVAHSMMYAWLAEPSIKEVDFTLAVTHMVTLQDLLPGLIWFAVVGTVQSKVSRSTVCHTAFGCRTSQLLRHEQDVHLVHRSTHLLKLHKSSQQLVDVHVARFAVSHASWSKSRDHLLQELGVGLRKPPFLCTHLLITREAHPLVII
jgi:hypothetical protein